MRLRGPSISRLVGLACLLVCAIGLASASPARADDTPKPPPAGQLPERSDCNLTTAATDPTVRDTCQLWRMCDDPNTLDQSALQQRCGELREREALRQCQIAPDNSDDCLDQTQRLTTYCAGVPPNAKDNALCWEFRHPLPPGGQPGSNSDSTTGSPSTATDDADKVAAPSGDPVRENGGVSPGCYSTNLDATTKRNCDQSGSISHQYPLSNYGLDEWVNVTHPVSEALQNISQMVWWVLLWILAHILLLLEWAFSIELFSKASDQIAVALRFLSDNVLGSSWMLAGIAIAGAWGLWNGFVRQRSIETLSGLVGTVLLMTVALYITHDPRGTVGTFTTWVNDSSVAALSLASAGNVVDPQQSYNNSQQKLFRSTVEAPWCVLEFGARDYCDVKNDQGVTVASDWLSVPSGDEHRKKLYGDLIKEHFCAPNRNPLNPFGAIEDLRRVTGHCTDGAASQAGVRIVRLQMAEGATERLAMIVLIAIGLLGAIALFGFLALHLILAATSTALMTMAAPFMLIAPGFGDGGRRFFVTWLKRLFGAVASKLVFALLLAVVILFSNIIAGLDFSTTGGWAAQWALSAAFWWGTFLKRQQILQAAYFGDRGEANSGFMHLASAYLGFRFARDLARAGKGAIRAPIRAEEKVRKTAVGLHHRHRERQNAAVAAHGQHEVETMARSAKQHQLNEDRNNALGTIDAQADRKRRLAHVRGRHEAGKRRLSHAQQELHNAQLEEGRLAAQANNLPADDPRHAELDDRWDANQKRIAAAQRRIDHITATGRRRGEEMVRLEQEVDLHEPDAAAARSLVGRLGTGGQAKVTSADVREQVDVWQQQYAGRDPGTLSADERRLMGLLQASQGAEYVTPRIRQAAMTEIFAGTDQPIAPGSRVTRFEPNDNTRRYQNEWAARKRVQKQPRVGRR